MQYYLLIYTGLALRNGRVYSAKNNICTQLNSQFSRGLQDRARRTEETLSLTLAKTMVQQSTTVQCQPLRSRDIRHRQGHGRQTNAQQLPNTHTHTHGQTRTRRKCGGHRSHISAGVTQVNLISAELKALTISPSVKELFPGLQRQLAPSSTPIVILASLLFYLFYYLYYFPGSLSARFLYPSQVMIRDIAFTLRETLMEMWL